MKASSKKNAIDLSLPSDSADAADAAAPVAAGEEERQSEPEESGGNNNKNKEEGEGEDAEEEEEEEEEEGEEEDDDEEEKEEAPKLEEGFYEIEDIRKKRVRNGQIQYLIKWRGWPESANTWEPLDNIRSCADMIEVFEERSSKSSRKRKRKYGRPHHTTTATARKKRSGPVPLAVPPAKPLLQGNDNGNFDSSKDEIKVTEDGEEEEANPTEGEGNTRTTEEENTAQVAAAGCITIQPNGTSRDDDGSMEDGSSKIDGTQPLHGAKKRKSGCVRRFKQESTLPPKQDDGGEKLGSENVDSTQDDNSGDGHKLDDSANPPHITKILKPVRYCASITDDVQQVSITFKALRSDGTEVLVDDKDLKVNNPLLLITYYEQHLRYSPHT